MIANTERRFMHLRTVHAGPSTRHHGKHCGGWTIGNSSGGSEINTRAAVPAYRLVRNAVLEYARCCGVQQPAPHLVASGGSGANCRRHLWQKRARNGKPLAALPNGAGADGPPYVPDISRSSSSSSSSSVHSSRSGDSALPVRLVELPGKGRGVVAARNLAPGELLLLCRPLALVRGAPLPPPHAPPPPPPPHQERGQPEQQRPQPPPAAGAKRAAANAARPPGPAAAAAAAAAAMAACSEGALVAELQRLRWGPRQARILAALYRGAEPAPAAPRPGAGAAAAAAPAAAAAATRLTNGAAGAAGLGTSGAVDLPELSDLADPWGDSSAVGPRSPLLEPLPMAAELGADGSTHGSVPPGLSPEQLAAVVRLNATGLPSDDVLLAQLYGIHNTPYIGLWPAHAMINHSCSPTAVAVVSDGLLAVRCCAPVPAGGEVCITYAGALGLGPLQLRRPLLERNHRFRCTCARCQAEERVPRELSQLWTDIVTLTSQQLQPRLMAAAAALKAADGDAGAISAPGAGAPTPTPAASASSSPPSPAVDPATLHQLLDVRSQVAKCCGLFEDTLRQLGRPPQEALWLQASMYSLYETRARCAQLLSSAAAAAAAAEPAATSAEAAARMAGAATAEGEGASGAGPGGAGETSRRLGEEYLAALSTCLRLQGVANAGSDMHVQLAARYGAACAAHASRHPGPREQQLAADAAQRLERALAARYGAVAAAAPPAGLAAAGPVAAAAVADAQAVLPAGVGATPPMEALLRLARALQRQQPL